MNELLFPTVGAALVALVVLPAFAALCLLMLRALERVSGSRLHSFRTVRFLLLVFPSLLPLAWALSAGLHQAETGRSVLACLISHDLEQLCIEPLLFVAMLAAFVLLRIRPFLWAARRPPRAASGLESMEVIRVEELIGRHSSLALLRGRIMITDGAVGGCATLGVLWPVVALDASFVQQCDDETLLGALAHELEHVRGRDPLRYLLLALSVHVNPITERLLGRHAAAWIFSREVQCDRAAVLAGAEPFGVARALLQASRPPRAAMAHISGAGAKLRLRVELALAYGERRPANDVAQGRSALLLVLVGALAVALPHLDLGGTDPLDVLHTAVERVAEGLLD
jgi:Zn-dependent protease with chaperone function